MINIEKKIKEMNSRVLELAKIEENLHVQKKKEEEERGKIEIDKKKKVEELTEVYKKKFIDLKKLFEKKTRKDNEHKKKIENDIANELGELTLMKLKNKISNEEYERITETLSN